MTNSQVSSQPVMWGGGIDPADVAATVATIAHILAQRTMPITAELPLHHLSQVLMSSENAQGAETAEQVLLRQQQLSIALEAVQWQLHVMSKQLQGLGLVCASAPTPPVQLPVPLPFTGEAPYMLVHDRVSTACSFALCDPATKGFPVCYASQGFRDLFPYVAGENLCPAFSVLSPTALGFLGRYTGEMWRRVAEGELPSGYALALGARADESLFVYEVAAFLLRHPTHGWPYLVGLHRDVSHEVSPAQLLRCALAPPDYEGLLRSRQATLERWLAEQGIGGARVTRHFHEKAEEVWDPTPLLPGNLGAAAGEKQPAELDLAGAECKSSSSDQQKRRRAPRQRRRRQRHQNSGGDLGKGGFVRQSIGLDAQAQLVSVQQRGPHG